MNDGGEKMEKQHFLPPKYINFIFGILILLGSYLTSLYSYLLFHSLTEIFSIVIACGIFMIAWNSRRFLDNNYLLFIGIAYLFVGSFDLIHTLAYKGMNIFHGFETNLPTQLWISARYMESFSFLIGPLLFRRKVKGHLVFLTYGAASTLLLLSIFYWNIFPVCFIEGRGLTPFKKISEYVISLILLASIVLLLMNRRNFDKNVLQWVVWSIILTIASELAFTFYADAYGFFNLVGHFFKILSFYFIYKALIETGLSKPHDLLLRNLKKNEEILHQALLEKKQRQIEISELLNAAKAVLEHPEFKDAAQTIFDSCKKVIGAAAGYISLLTKDGDQNEVVFLDSGGLPCTVDPNLPMPIRGLRAEAYRTSKTIYHNDFQESDYMKFLPEGHSTLHSVLFSPLTIDGKVIGLLGLANKPDGFNENDVRITSGFSEIASIALYNSRTLEALGHNEERFRSVVQTAGDAIISVDKEGRIVFWNRSAESIFGYSSDEVLGGSLTFMMPERFREVHQRAMNRVVSTGQSNMIGKKVEMVGLRKDGVEFPLELSLASWETKEEVFFTGILRDITERKKVEEVLQKAHTELEAQVKKRTEELSLANKQLRHEIDERQRAENAFRESETKYRIVADNTYDWETWVTQDDHFIYVSPSCKRITGHDQQEFLSDPNLFFRIIHPDDQSIFTNHQNKVNQELMGGEVEFRIFRPDGSYRWIGHECQPVFDAEKNFLGHRGSNRDITERKLAEEGLLESEQRLRLLSSQLLTVQETERKRVAREIHDSIGQTLAAIKFGLESKLSQMSGGMAPPGVLIENIISLTQNGIDEARRIQMDLRPSVLDDLGIMATIGWFTREFQKVYSHISVEKQVSVEEDEIPDSLKIVLFRVMQEAMNNIAKHSQANLVRLSLRKIEGRIELSIGDNGSGFDPKSTKQGLGLTSMKERTEFSEGVLEVKSMPGTGTIIKASWAI
jgi:PAS domain S-box-containing protein